MSMLRCWVLVIASLLCLQTSLCQHSSGLGWEAWLFIEPKPSHNEGQHEEETPKIRRITPKSVFVAPSISGGSPLPDCAEGYKADPMGRCVKLVTLNHAAQLGFLLQRLNAVYAVRPAEFERDSMSGPLHVTIPIQQEEGPRDDLKKKHDEAEKPIEYAQKIELLEAVSDEELVQEEPSVVDPVKDPIVDFINVERNSTDLDMEPSSMNVEKTNSSAKYNGMVPENSSEAAPEPVKNSDSISLLEEVASMISEDSRLGNTSRRNVSAAERPNSSVEFIVKKTGGYAYSHPRVELPSDVHARRTYWWLPQGWRLEPASQQEPVLIRFWARMPLLHDPEYQHSMPPDSYHDGNVPRRRRPLVYV